MALDLFKKAKRSAKRNHVTPKQYGYVANNFVPNEKLKLNSNQESVLQILLFQEPNYKFKYNESAIAKRMADRGLLKQKFNGPKPVQGEYTVTEAGKRAYKVINPKAKVEKL